MFTKLLIIAFLLLQPVFSFPLSPRQESETDFTLSEESSSEAVSERKEALVPQKISNSLGIKLTAKSAVVLDRKSGAILFEKNPYQRLSIASLTKIMTGVVVLESSSSLDEIVTVSGEAAKVEPKNIKLLVEEQITIRDLLYASLMASANDAALALAEHIGPGLAKFIEKMNKKAQDLELQNTQFINPTGLDEEGNYSTAFDLARLFDYVLENETIQNILVTREYTARSTNTQSTHLFRNTNDLLDSYLNVKGGKTGFTDEAGWCLVELAENGQGNQIIGVILGPESDKIRFQETKAIIDWTFRNYKWE